MKTKQNTITKGVFIISLLSVSLTSISTEIQKAKTFGTPLKGQVLKLVKYLREKEKLAEQKIPAKRKIIEFKIIMKISEQDVRKIALNLNRNATTSINTFIALARKRNSQSRAIDNIIENTEPSSIRNRNITRLRKRRVKIDKGIVRRAQELDNLFENYGLKKYSWHKLIYDMRVSIEEGLK